MQVMIRKMQISQRVRVPVPPANDRSPMGLAAATLPTAVCSEVEPHIVNTPALAQEVFSEEKHASIAKVAQ